MRVLYYPGCTLKTRARNLGDTAVAAMALLGVEMEELSRWNCCGAVHSLADDDLIHQVAPVRVLIRASEQGGNRLLTLCSMCYNSLARANLLMRDDKEKRDTINLFMDEEEDYRGDVEVVHLLPFLRDEVGWDKLREKIRVPLKGLKIAPYYGCTLTRPREIAIEPVGSTGLMTQLLETLGATVVHTQVADLCCGSYQILGNPDASRNATAAIQEGALKAGAEALAMSCPLCEFNLGREGHFPVFYFTQLLALALGLGPEACHLELNNKASLELFNTLTDLMERQK